MSLLIRLHVFSGNPDPLFVLAGGADEEILARAESAKLTQPARRGLGYRGFSLLPTGPDDRIDALAGANGLSGSHHGLFVSGEPDLEEHLFDLARKHLDLSKEVFAHVRETIGKTPPDSLEVKAKGCPAVKAQNPPAYNPGWWNNDPVRLPNNNCYNYANNQATNTFAQPGRATGRPITGLSCAGVQPSAVSDGLRAAPGFDQPTPGWYVALVIWPGVDYHWYRQDDNGCWSHKPGSTPVINTDNSGNQITDPAACDRGPYTDFCTYMITNTGVRIR